MSKKGLLIFGLIFVSLFLFSVNFVSADSCSITTSCASANTVMKLSSATNAHGALYDQGSYTYYLCCDFQGTHTCDGSNKILGLSTPTNAHAQIKTYTSYNYEVCYGDLSCTVIDGSLIRDDGGMGSDATAPTAVINYCPSTFPIQMVSLSDVSNAHIGGPNDYFNMICCERNPTAECGNGIVEPANNEECDDGNLNDYTQEGYPDGCTSTCEVMSGWDCTGSPNICVNNAPEKSWIKDGNIITETTLKSGETLIASVLSSFGLSVRSTITFTIYEIDRFAWIRYNTREIGTYRGTVGVVSVSSATINIDETFLNELQSDSENTYELIFEVGGMESGVLKVTDILPPDCTDTCTSLGYQCGTHTICGVSTNCGTCSTGTCNSAGQCITPTPNCTITSASWSTEGPVVENSTVNLNVGVSDCDGQTVSFVVKENDFIGSNDVITNPPIRNVSVGATSVTSAWVAEYQEDGGTDPEYFFTASIGSLSLKSSNELTVTEKNDEECINIGVCGDYTESQCNLDPCNVAKDTVPEGIPCGFGVDCNCKFSGGICNSGWGNWTSCNNGIINIGEQCDGSNWGPITNCSNFGYDGGTLSCNGCVFDTSLCTGKQDGTCGDKVINTGEQCDTYTLPFTNCTRFDDFTGGTLVCNEYCVLNTNVCEGGIEGDDHSKVGCIYTDNNNYSCEDDRILERDMIATWIGDGEQPSACANFKDTLVCPAQIEVSFFGALQFIIAILLVIIIYIIIKSRIKKHDKKVSKKSKSKKRK